MKFQLSDRFFFNYYTCDDLIKMLYASFPLLYRYISLAKPRRARCEMRDWKAKVRRSTCQAHCPLDAPSFRIRVGYLRR